MKKKLPGILSKKQKIAAAMGALVLIAGGITAATFLTGKGETIERMESKWPDCFAGDDYKEPGFVDNPNRENHAFNVADFGKQGSNGWFYRYGKASKPQKSKQIEEFDGEVYRQIGVSGLEMKKDFIQPGEKEASILEWRVAKKGSIDLMVTYVKNVNADKNPSYPDGVTISIYKGEELLKTDRVDVKTDKEVLMEAKLEDLPVKEGESLYMVVDGKANNAYDGGLLYAAIVEAKKQKEEEPMDKARTDNNADFAEDFKKQGSNGWYYMYGKDTASAALVSTETKNGYINYTSPGLQIEKDFIHPAINDNAIIGWKPKDSGLVEIRGSYTKFEQKDGNPNWPDGVTVSIYLNQKKLFEKRLEAPKEGINKISFRERNLKVTAKDRLYFVVNANGNASYDGGKFDIAILDRNGMGDENSVEIDESETRQNFANVKDDFASQGSNGWFYQEGYEDEPFGAYNMEGYVKDDKYADKSYLEIKRDFVNTGKNNKSAVIKWRVAQDGVIAVDASYTKMKNMDKNPSWPDGTRVTIYHNSSPLIREEFAPDVFAEVTKSLDIDEVEVQAGDYITMVVNGKDNNAYDGGKYTFAIRSISGLVGQNEQDIPIENDSERTNNACVFDDFGEQGNNGWFYQYGYYTDPFFAVNIERYEDGEKYLTKDGIEIKKDYIMPSTKDKSANVKWKVAKDGQIDIKLNYTKLKNEDANPSWPDGTVVTLLHNQTVLRSEEFAPDTESEITKDMSVMKLSVEEGDYITMIVNGKDNTAYDGGLYSFSIEEVGEDENSFDLDESETRQNFANVKDDFGSQGSNGWFYQKGYKDEPFGGYNLRNYSKDDKYTDDGDLEIKRDFVNPGKNNKSAVIKWRVAQNGVIAIDASYTKMKNMDKNPSWPDGTRVTIYHNSSSLIREEFEPNVFWEVTKNLSVDCVEVEAGDYITMVVNGKSNNAYDGGKYTFAIRSISGLAGQTERNITIENDSERTNNASVFDDFGDQGSNGWFYQYGYYTDPFFAVNIERYEKEEKYVTKDGIEIKRDYIMPSTKDKSANVKWKVAKDGQIDINLSYTKLKNEDANPSWPDGTVVTLLHNKTVLRSEAFAADTEKEITKDLSVTKLKVKKGDYITMIVNGRSNTAYDGGLYSFSIEEVNLVTVDKVNDSSENSANLESDFGKQGQNGWYYLEGTSVENAKLLYQKTADDAGYRSNKDKDLEIKKDFVMPGKKSHAIYQWVAAQDGEVDILGNYIKYGHEDKNPSWPDGTRIKVYKKGQLLLDKEAKVLQGDGNNSSVEITLEKIAVKKGEIFTFAVEPKENNAWDGGKLSIQISPYESEPESYMPAPDNQADLFEDFGEQGNEGWYYGSGNSSEEFKPAFYNNGEYSSVKHENLLLKKDGVHPSADAGAIYRWIAGESGKIDLSGVYYKASVNDANDNAADGVRVAVYLNGELIPQMLYDIEASKTEEISKIIEKEGIDVSKGDKLDFIITAKENASWDYGKLEMSIRNFDSSQPPVDPENPPKEDNTRENTGSLSEDFGEQGNNGWYYGMCEWNGKNFQELTYDSENDRYFNDGKPELKKDFAEPGAGKNAAYKWVAAKSGKIKIQGEYTKFANSEDPNADGVCLRIFHNLVEKKWIGDGIMQGGLTSEVTVQINEVLTVKKGDEIMFAINPEGNDSYDGGRLELTISPTD